MSRFVRSVRRRFRETIEAMGGRRRLVVAVSGGLDSSVLLHLAHFVGRQAGCEVVAAHYDHRMRASSGDDARWVAGLCRAWDVPLRLGEAGERLESEEDARTARYRFLEAVRRDEEARTDAASRTLVVTAHHADDQAETVLFRLFRGSGSRGLSGIPAHRSPSIHRPLLDFWRAELEQYARAVRLSWREDPSNRDTTFARNAIRATILPEVERLVAPGARRSLVRLAAAASDDEAAWQSVLPELMAPLDVTEVAGGFSLRKTPFLRLHPGVRMRILRVLALDLGVSLDRATARRASAFAEDGASGRAIDLAGSVALGVDLDRFVLARPAPVGEDLPLTIYDAGPGHGMAVLAGSPVPVTWGSGGAVTHRSARGFDPDALRFPLVVRSRRPGDRIRLGGGTKKVKKLLLEHRIPPSARHRVALVVDAEGEVLWIPSLASAAWSGFSESEGALRIGVG